MLGSLNADGGFAQVWKEFLDAIKDKKKADGDTGGGDSGGGGGGGEGEDSFGGKAKDDAAKDEQNKAEERKELNAMLKEHGPQKLRESFWDFTRVGRFISSKRVQRADDNDRASTRTRPCSAFAAPASGTSTAVRLIHSTAKTSDP